MTREVNTSFHFESDGYYRLGRILGDAIAEKLSALNPRRESMNNPIDDMIKTLPPPVPPGPMRVDTLAARIIRALYLFGPCTEETLMTQVALASSATTSAQSWSMALSELGAAVTRKMVLMPGRPDPVHLLHVRGGGVG